MLSAGCSQEKTAEENVREPEKNAVFRTSEETVSVLPTAEPKFAEPLPEELSMTEEISEPELPGEHSDPLPGELPDALPGEHSDPLPGELPDALPGEHSDPLPETLPETLPGELPDALPETLSGSSDAALFKDLPDLQPNVSDEDGTCDLSPEFRNFGLHWDEIPTVNVFQCESSGNGYSGSSSLVKDSGAVQFSSSLPSTADTDPMQELPAANVDENSGYFDQKTLPSLLEQFLKDTEQNNDPTPEQTAQLEKDHALIQSLFLRLGKPDKFRFLVGFAAFRMAIRLENEKENEKAHLHFLTAIENLLKCGTDANEEVCQKVLGYCGLWVEKKLLRIWNEQSFSERKLAIEALGSACRYWSLHQEKRASLEAMKMSYADLRVGLACARLEQAVCLSYGKQSPTKTDTAEGNEEKFLEELALIFGSMDQNDLDFMVGKVREDLLAVFKLYVSSLPFYMYEMAPLNMKTERRLQIFTRFLEEIENLKRAGLIQETDPEYLVILENLHAHLAFCRWFLSDFSECQKHVVRMREYFDFVSKNDGNDPRAVKYLDFRISMWEVLCAAKLADEEETRRRYQECLAKCGKIAGSAKEVSLLCANTLHYLGEVLQERMKEPALVCFQKVLNILEMEVEKDPQLLLNMASLSLFFENAVSLWKTAAELGNYPEAEAALAKYEKMIFRAEEQQKAVLGELPDERKQNFIIARFTLCHQQRALASKQNDQAKMAEADARLRELEGEVTKLDILSLDTLFFLRVGQKIEEAGRCEQNKDTAGVRQAFEEALGMLEMIEESQRTAVWMLSFAAMLPYPQLFEGESKEGVYQRLIDLCRSGKENDPENIVHYYGEILVLSIKAADTGQKENALNLCIEAAEVCKAMLANCPGDMRNGLMLVSLDRFLADAVLRDRNDLAEAKRYLAEAEKVFAPILEKYPEDCLDDKLALSITKMHIHRSEKKYPEALALAEKNLEELQNIDQTPEIFVKFKKIKREHFLSYRIDCLHTAAECYLAAGQKNEARKPLEKIWKYIEEAIQLEKASMEQKNASQNDPQNASQNDPTELSRETAAETTADLDWYLKLKVILTRMAAELEEGEKREELLRKADEEFEKLPDKEAKPVIHVLFSAHIRGPNEDPRNGMP